MKEILKKALTDKNARNVESLSREAVLNIAFTPWD